MIKKLGDTIYWKEPDGRIHSGEIIEINEKYETIRYETYKCSVPECDCLEESDPEVQEYIQEHNVLWIARDKNDGLFVYKEKPYLDPYGAFDSDKGGCFVLDPKMYPEVTFENSPKKLKVLFPEECKRPLVNCHVCKFMDSCYSIHFGCGCNHGEERVL